VNGRIRTTRPFLAFAQIFLSCVGAVFLAPLLQAQGIHIRALNARNGKAVRDECLNVWVGPVHGEALYAPTNHDGVAMLHISDSEVMADAVSDSACNVSAALGPRSVPKGADRLAVAGGNYVVCQEYGKIVPGDAANPNLVGELMPSYSIGKILQSGVTAANTCGKFRAEARPGELILFVRPRSFLEKLRM
jgi:hypothetical protein